MNWRLIAFEMGLFWNDQLRSKNARRANVLRTNALRANASRMSATILFTKHQLSSSASSIEDDLNDTNE